ncbi:MAG: TolC family protein [Syntrophales bacterium]|jgi:outer membrane protein TolC
MGKLRFLSAHPLWVMFLMITWGLVFILQGIAWSEELKKERIIMTLPELIGMAIAKSPEIGEIQSEIGMARSDLEQVKAAYFPQLESTALVGPVRDAKEPEILNGRITDPSPSLSASSIGIFGRLDVTMTQPLYTFGKLSNRKEAADKGVRAKEFQLEEKNAQIALRVKKLYYALVLARAGVEAANEAGGFFEEAGRSIHRLLEISSPNAKEGDIYLIDAYQADTIRSKAESEKGAKVAYFTLKSMIGLPPGVGFDTADKTLSMKREDLADVESYIQEAKDKRPEFKQLAEALAAQKSKVEAAASDRYPSFFVALQASLAGAPGRDSLHNPYIRDDFNHTDAGVVAGLKWNFDFGIGRAKIDKMMAEYNKLLYTRASAEMNTIIQVSNIYEEQLEWQQAVNSYQRAANASRKWVFTAMADFGMGVGTAEEMLKAIERYGHNQGKYIEALFHYNLSLAELEYAVGMKAW